MTRHTYITSGKVSSTLILTILHEVNKHTANGGVTAPTQPQRIEVIPYAIGSTPNYYILTVIYCQLAIFTTSYNISYIHYILRKVYS